MLCARTTECLSYNFCFEKFCQLNRNDVLISNESLVHDRNCDYVGTLEKDTPDCFDGKESSRLGNNCNLEFKIGNLWVTKCLNVTTPITNISEFEVQLVHVCNEIYCYRGQRKVNQSLCKIRIGVPFLTRIANYAGNMTWQQGFDYCLGMGLPFREIYSSYLDDFGQPHNGLRRLDHPAYIHLFPGWGPDLNWVMIRPSRAHTRVSPDRNYRVFSEVRAHYGLDHGLEMVWS